MKPTYLVTGGAGFIGSNFISEVVSSQSANVVNLDALTYAGNIGNLESVNKSAEYHFVRGDIKDKELVSSLLESHKPSAVFNFAAETHVDRSIAGPASFVETNVMGTISLLTATLDYWQELRVAEKYAFRFFHISTDEVYGSLGPSDAGFSEKTQIAPNSPYSASKAASDHMVRAWHHTYGLPTITSNCSNNYGPRQFPEKLIPLLIARALAERPLPIYGDGLNVRDWLYVEDHCDALLRLLKAGGAGEVYNIGGLAERTNVDVVNCVCETLDRFKPRRDSLSYKDLITFVADRPGHDRRYAVNISKIKGQIGWQPKTDFTSGIEKTVAWYLNNASWLEDVTTGAYRAWIDEQYGNRKSA